MAESWKHPNIFHLFFSFLKMCLPFCLLPLLTIVWIPEASKIRNKANITQFANPLGFLNRLQIPHSSEYSFSESDCFCFAFAFFWDQWKQIFTQILFLHCKSRPPIVSYCHCIVEFFQSNSLPDLYWQRSDSLLSSQVCLTFSTYSSCLGTCDFF